MIRINFENGGMMSLGDDAGQAIRDAWHDSLHTGFSVIIVTQDGWKMADPETATKIKAQMQDAPPEQNP